MNWILIVWVVNGYGGALTQPTKIELKSEKSCMEAVQALDQTKSGIRSICIHNRQ